MKRKVAKQIITAAYHGLLILKKKLNCFSASKTLHLVHTSSNSSPKLASEISKTLWHLSLIAILIFQRSTLHQATTNSSNSTRR